MLPQFNQPFGGQQIVPAQLPTFGENLLRGSRLIGVVKTFLKPFTGVEEGHVFAL
jgi:hypothetical protein